jgi:plastocyanin
MGRDGALERGVERGVLLVLLIAGALWVAALFGFASGYISGDPPRQSPYASGDDDPAEITISGFDFGDPITVESGSAVRVTNRDSTAHTWTSLDGLFDSETIEPGESFEFSFDTAGTFDFLCVIHPQMTGTITVSD